MLYHFIIVKYRHKKIRVLLPLKIIDAIIVIFTSNTTRFAKRLFSEPKLQFF